MAWPFTPVSGSRFPLAIAQRIDVRVKLPREGAFPILAFREGATEQTGLILATRGASIRKLPVKNAAAAGLLTWIWRAGWSPRIHWLRSRSIKVSICVCKAIWPAMSGLSTASSSTPQIRDGQKGPGAGKTGSASRGEVHQRDRHVSPMHLHGHSFQVIEINGKPLNGPSRHHSCAAKNERHCSIRRKQSWHLVFTLPHPLASGSRHGDVSAVRGVTSGVRQLHRNSGSSIARSQFGPQSKHATLRNGMDWRLPVGHFLSCRRTADHHGEPGFETAEIRCRHPPILTDGTTLR